MHKTLHTLLLVCNILATIASVLWFMRDVDYEPFIVLILSIAGLSALYHTNPTKKSVKQTIKSGKDSTNMQAGKTINIRSDG